MSNISFNVGELIWAKIRGYPWWPAIITGTEDDNREKKYNVSFIGDKSHSSLAKKCLEKFEKGLKLYSNTKKKNLQDVIEKAKIIYYNKNGNKDKEILFMMKKNIRPKEKENQQNKNINNYNKPKNSEIFNNKKKLKKVEDKTEIDLVYKICNYLKHITVVMLQKDKKFDFEKNKDNLCKILKYLAEYKIQEPIEFLKKSNMGKYIKYINDHVENEEIKSCTTEVYKNFETQVLSQLLKQK
jgi:hypothetical protein